MLCSAAPSRHAGVLLYATFLSALMAALCAPTVNAGDHIDELMQGLRANSGAAYVAARAQALALPATGQTDLIRRLRASERDSQDRLLARVISARTERPEVARRFDDQLRQSKENPSTRGASPDPIYTAWWPRESDYDPLGFEALLKLDLPQGLRSAFQRAANRTDPENTDTFLYLCRTQSTSYAWSLVACTQDNPGLRAEITPLLSEYHVMWRQRGHTSTGVFSTLAAFGGEQQLQELLRLREFERGYLTDRGLTPWTHRTTREDLTTATRDLIAAQRRLQEATSLDGTPEQVEELQEAVVAAEGARRNVEAQRQASAYWDKLERAIADLETRAKQDQGGAGAPPSE